MVEAGGEAVHLRPPMTHVRLLLPTLDGRIVTRPVTEAALASSLSQQDEVFSWLNWGHTPMGRATGLSLRPGQFLHTPSFRSCLDGLTRIFPISQSNGGMVKHRMAYTRPFFDAPETEKLKSPKKGVYFQKLYVCPVAGLRQVFSVDCHFSG